MKNSLRFTFVLAAVILVFAFVSDGFSQRVVLGGYKKIAKSDTGAAAAADFAVEAQAKKKKNATIELVEIEKAESQVVAGTNYRLCLKVTTSGEKGEADVTITVQVVVFKNLKGAYSLTSWKEDDCADDDDDG